MQVDYHIKFALSSYFKTYFSIYKIYFQDALSYIIYIDISLIVEKGQKKSLIKLFCLLCINKTYYFIQVLQSRIWILICLPFAKCTFNYNAVESHSLGNTTLN